MYVTGGAATSLIPYVGQSKYLKLLKVEKDKATNTKAVNPAIAQKVKEIVQNNKVFEGIKKETVELYKDIKNGGTRFVDDVTDFLGRTLFPNQSLQMSTANSVPVNVFSRATVEDRIDSVVSRSSVKVDMGTSEKVNNIKEIDDVNYGEHFTKGKRGRKELAPNVRYVTQDGYKYVTDELGRIVDVEADNLILQEADRNLEMQRAVGREDRLPDDDGGHLIGSQFHGSGDIDNLVAQNSQINRSGGEWYKMETVWANALKKSHRRRYL